MPPKNIIYTLLIITSLVLIIAAIWRLKLDWSWMAFFVGLSYVISIIGIFIKPFNLIAGLLAATTIFVGGIVVNSSTDRAAGIAAISAAYLNILWSVFPTTEWACHFINWLLSLVGLANHRLAPPDEWAWTASLKNWFSRVLRLNDWLEEKREKAEIAKLEHAQLVELVLKMQKEMDSLKSEVDSLKAFKQKVEAQQLDGQSTSFTSHQTFHSFAAEHSNSPPSFSAHPSSSNVFSGQRTPLQLANFDEQMSGQTSSSSSTYGAFQPIRKIGDRRHSITAEQRHSPLPSSSAHLPSSTNDLRTPPPPAPQPPASSSAHFSSSSLISRRTSPLPKRKIVNKDYLMLPQRLRKWADEQEDEDA